MGGEERLMPEMSPEPPGRPEVPGISFVRAGVLAMALAFAADEGNAWRRSHAGLPFLQGIGVRRS